MNEMQGALRTGARFGTGAQVTGAVSKATLPGCVVHAERLSKTFGSHTVWSDMEFRLKPGTMTALSGPSGSGKTTLLNCIGLLEEPTSGSLQIDGEEALGMNSGEKRAFRRDKLGYLFQDYALVDNATVEKNLELAMLGTPRRARAERMDQALKAVGLAGRRRDMVYTMSGGEQQRVALARLIVKRPGLVLADEPTGALDEANARMVIAMLRGMARQGATIVIATHSSHVVDACDNVILVGR